MACSPGTPGAALDELLTLNLARLGANERDAAAHASLAAVLERIAGRSAAPSAAEDGPAAIAPSGAGGAVEVDLNYITMAAQRWFRSGNLRYNAGVATYGEALGAFDRCLELAPVEDDGTRRAENLYNLGITIVVVALITVTYEHPPEDRARPPDLN